MVILLLSGYRRWLSRPWQWSLRDYVVTVAVCAGALSLAGSPIPVILFLTALAVAVYFCLNLARHGMRLIDIVTMLAIILITAAFLLPAMQQTRNQTMGKRYFPSIVPARYLTLLAGSE
jgi:hypothetical protein